MVDQFLVVTNQCGQQRRLAGSNGTMHPGKEPGSEEWGSSVNEKQSQMKDRSSSGIAWVGVRSGQVAFARPRNCRARAERDPLFAPLLNPGLAGAPPVGYRCLRAYSASNSDRASLSNDSREPVMRQMLSPGSSVSSSRSGTLSVPIADSSRRRAVSNRSRWLRCCQVGVAQPGCWLHCEVRRRGMKVEGDCAVIAGFDVSSALAMGQLLD